MSDNVMESLITLLELERTEILAGNYQAVTDLGPQKEQLLGAIGREEADRASLSLLTVSLTQNQRLLAAAIKGIASARERMAALDKVRDGLSVYDRRGKVAHVPREKPGLVRKA